MNRLNIIKNIFFCKVCGLKKMIILGLLTGLSNFVCAQNINLENVNNTSVDFEKAEITIAKNQGVLATSIVTYYGPRVWVNGRLQNLTCKTSIRLSVFFGSNSEKYSVCSFFAFSRLQF